MTIHPIRRHALILLAMLLPLHAEEPALRDLLRDALYTEEVNRDAEKAASQYEALIARSDEQRAYAASALSRLAAIREKQDRKEEAVALYQRILHEFPGAKAEAKLASENLTRLGGKPTLTEPALDSEDAQIKSLQELALEAPDRLLEPEALESAASNGSVKVVRYLLEHGAKPYKSKALAHAVKVGNLSICQEIIGKAGLPPAELSAKAISEAIYENRIAILRFLFESGVHPDSDGFNSIGLAVHVQRPETPDELLPLLAAHHADLDRMDATSFSSSLDRSGPEKGPLPGTALHLAIADGNYKTANVLLDLGAKADLPSTVLGVTPLHLAAASTSPDSAAMVARLLKAGALADRRSSTAAEDKNLSPDLQDVTPMSLVAGQGSVAKIKLLLEAGAKAEDRAGPGLTCLAIAAKRGDMELARLLISAGARANRPEVLASAIHSGNVEILNLVLDAGCDPNVSFAGLGKLALGNVYSDEVADGLMLAATLKGGFPSLKILIEKGAKLDSDWFTNRSIRGWQPETTALLVKSFAYPKYFAQSSITLHSYDDTAQVNEWLELLNSTSQPTPPDFAKLMLANGWRFPKRGNNAARSWNDTLILVRRSPDGKVTEREFNLESDEPLPALAWGDVIRQEIGHPNDRIGNNWPDKQEWQLRRRVSFPITAEIAGRTREILVRGDRILFDPTKDEVPWRPAQKVVDFLWQGEAAAMGSTLVVSRKGWPDIRLPYSSNEARKFELEAGDRLKLEIPDEVSNALSKQLASYATLKAIGLPYVRRFGGSPADEACFPTLVQALVETQIPATASVMRPNDERLTTPSSLSIENAPYAQFTLLPRPDLSRIRITRMLEGGGSKLIEVDLAKAIAASGDQTTSAEARNADIQLLPGDLVEIPVLTNTAAKPWKGFSARENAFFAKVLSGRVRVTDKDDQISIREISYNPPDYLETQAGWLPLPPKTGVPSASAAWMAPTPRVTIRRGSISSNLSAKAVFIRDGDELRMPYSPSSR